MNTKQEHISIWQVYWSDFAQLVKMRLSLTVVFSSILSYLIAGGYSLHGWVGMVILFCGGFFVTASSNIINEVLEKDYDVLMERTKNRPIAAQRMTTSTGVLMAGIFLVLGIFLLCLFNPLTAVVGSMAFCIYAFVYTPLKRTGTIAVYIGAIAGALPCLIGVVAAQNTISHLAIALFTIQFFWQLPHFWAIAWLAFNDYKKAGYKFLPTQTQSPVFGKLAAFGALGLIPIVIFMYAIGEIGLIAFVVSMLMNLLYIYFSYQMMLANDRAGALRVMFYSFLYLPVVLLAFFIETLF